MTYFNPSRRISACQALARLRELNAESLKDHVRSEILHRPHAFGDLWFPYATGLGFGMQFALVISRLHGTSSHTTVTSCKQNLSCLLT
jgi:hypothetical protein